MTIKIKHETLVINGIQIHVAQAGPKDGPVVLFLHGFPEFWYGWRNQIEYFAKAGYCVIAPDQRGYNLSDKPSRVADYDVDLLASDMIGVLDHFGKKKKAFVVGHDWGGIVAWWLALKYPERVAKHVSLNSPHPVAMSQLLKKSWAQLFKSWYIFFFQIPKLPEYIFKRKNFELWMRTLKSTSRRGTFTNADLEVYRTAWYQPGALTAMINWYRASATKSLKSVRKIKLEVPTLILWGEQDAFLNKMLAAQSAERCQNVEIKYFPEVTHWIQHEEPEQVNALLHDFFKDK